MRSYYSLGNVYQLWLTAMPSALVASLVLWVVATAVFSLVFNFSRASSLLGGLLVLLLHWFGELFHHFGHAVAARRTGHPMRGIRLWYLLGMSIYPKDEGDLPAEVHIQRALGGPIASLLLASLLALLIWLLPQNNSLLLLLAQFAFWENLLVFFLGAFLPLGFTDGSTLLAWWPKRQT